MFDLFRASRFRLTLVAGAALLSGASLSTSAQAQPSFINFTGTDGSGGILSGTATVQQEGTDVSVQAFTATFSNLLQEGAVSDTATFTLPDVADVTWYTAGNANGLGLATFSFDFSGTENGLTGYSCYYDCVYLTDNNWANYFTTTVTSYAVPEPASVAILGLGIVGCAAVRRRRQAS